MTLKELKSINKRISRLTEQLERLRSAAYRVSASTEPYRAGGIVSDKVGMNAAKIADLTAELDKLTEERNAALNSLSYESDAAICIWLHVARGYSWQRIAEIGEDDTAEAVRAMCRRYKWTVKNSPS